MNLRNLQESLPLPPAVLTVIAIMTIAGNMIGAAVSLLWGVWHG